MTHGPGSVAALNEDFFQRYPMLEIKQSKKEIAGLGLHVPRGCRAVEPSRCSERAGSLSQSMHTPGRARARHARTHARAHARCQVKEGMTLNQGYYAYNLNWHANLR